MFGSFSFRSDGNDPWLPGRIGLMGAMPEENHLVERAISVAQTREIARRDYVSGTLEGLPVAAVFSRWGKVAAAATTATLIEQFETDLVVFVGVAGAADPDLNVGDVVIGQNLFQHDMDVSGLPQFSKYEIPLLDVMSFSSEPRFTEIAAQSAAAYLKESLYDDIAGGLLSEFGLLQPKVVTGDIGSGDQFINDPARVEELRRDWPQLQAVEMEGAAMAQVAHEHGVPFVVIRIVSDRADHSAHLDFPRFIQEVAARMAFGLVRSFLTHVKTYAEPGR
ncbi:MAG: 5'-methylthioadenosine/adenosylhomocysteine nucleosidase [Verrucomicrobiota bacterium]